MGLLQGTLLNFGMKVTILVHYRDFWSKIYLYKQQTHPKKQINAGCSKDGLRVDYRGDNTNFSNCLTCYSDMGYFINF